VDELARGLTTLLAEDELRARLSARCREIAETEFSVDLQVQRYAGLYEELLDGSAAR
jgi:glycosyltransferase involved in cell wall biosynthesis